MQGYKCGCWSLACSCCSRFPLSRREGLRPPTRRSASTSPITPATSTGTRFTAEGYRFVYVKATEGVDAADPMFEHHWTSLKELEIPRGAYHFYVTEDDPAQQAEFFLSRIAGDPGDLVPVVDIELIGHGTSGSLAPRLRRFLDIVEQRTGLKPAIYTSPNFWDEHLDDSFGDHPLWVAEYGVEEPQIPAGWSDYTLWQYSGGATVQGVDNDADLSRLHPELDIDHLRIPSADP